MIDTKTVEKGTGSLVIEKYASQVHAILKLEDNFNIKKVVTGLGGTIEEGFLNTGIVAQLTNISNKKSEPSFEIKISNLIDSEEKIRFAIAHELGHLFIHLGFLDEKKWSENCKLSIVYHREEMSTGIEETEANTFAVAFLMPINRFRIVANTNLNKNIYNIEQIAKQFGVSKMSAYYRGVNLGLWT